MSRLPKIILFSVILTLAVLLCVIYIKSLAYSIPTIFSCVFCLIYLFNASNKTIKPKVIEPNFFSKKNNASSSFLEDLAHEMKTPLFSIQGYIETLLDGAINDENVRVQYVKNMSNAADRLTALISDLDTIHDLEKEKILLHYSTFDGIAVIKEVYELLSSEAKKYHIILRMPSKPEVVMILADKNRITQVFTNLISNAITYSNKTNVVDVSFIDTGKEWRITVSDTGMGISKADIKNIFDRFYRVDKSRNRKKGGSGLGLTIVKQILLAHKKEISVKSVLNEGTSFYFELDKA